MFSLEVILWYIILASVLTYIVLGVLFAFEGVLAMGGSRPAIKWIRKKFTLKGFLFAVKLCYPFFLLMYFFMELMPYYLKMDDELTEFDVSKMILNIFEDEYKL
jgi:hypothetical protein